MGRDQQPKLGGGRRALGRGKGPRRERRAEVDAANAARKSMQDLAVVFVGHHAEHQLDRPIRVQVEQSIRQRLSAVGVVGDVQKHAVNLLETAWPTGGREPRRDGVFRNRQPVGREKIERRFRHRGVLSLMGPSQGERPRVIA